MSAKDPPADAVGPIIMPPEDQLGMSIADVLRDHFDSSRRLLERCEVLAGAESDDAVNAIIAASRLLRSNAQMAFGVARVARIETRHRSIVERVQPPELNSKKIDDNPNKGAKDKLIREIELAREVNRNLEKLGLDARVPLDEFQIDDEDDEEN